MSNDDVTEYRLLIEKFIDSDVDMVVITDHNTIKGYYCIKRIFDGDKELKNRFGFKVILPGGDITCYGKHFIDIFLSNVAK